MRIWRVGVAVLVCVSGGLMAQAERCVPDEDSGPMLPECAVRTERGAMRIAPAFLKGLDFRSKYGLEGLYTPKLGWMYVDRRGRVVVHGLMTMDNGADYFRSGLARVMRDGKVGYADRWGRMVIPAIYDGAYPFERGLATVCLGCTSVCADQDTAESTCEHHVYAGGEMFSIDRRGRRVR